MRRVLHCALLVLLLPLLSAAQDQPQYPKIVAIEFEGNKITQPRTMLREMVIQPGYPADPEQIERSRQGVLDLGLFHRVKVREEPADGGVRVIFSVDERYYLFPVPRVDAKTDGRYAYGAQLRWSNVGGLNHSLDIILKRENQQQQDSAGQDTSLSVGYQAPFFLDSPYRLSTGLKYITRPVEGVNGNYTEDIRTVSVGGSRTYSDGAASQGFTVGTDLIWRSQSTSGIFAEPAYGQAIASKVYIGNRTFHYHVYSETGEAWSLSVEGADPELGSDYGYTEWNGSYLHSMAVGSTPYQTLQLRGNFGLHFDGPPGVHAYALGGSEILRAYNNNFVEGNAYYYSAIEFARPVGWNWLRLVVLLEAGNAFERSGDVRFGRLYSDLGIAVRLRLPKFVNFEVELGYAYPLDDRGGGRVFAARL